MSKAKHDACIGTLEGVRSFVPGKTRRGHAAQALAPRVIYRARFSMDVLFRGKMRGPANTLNPECRHFRMDFRNIKRDT